MPFLLLGRIYKPAWKIAGQITIASTTVLRWTQPWWRGDLKVHLPEKVQKWEQGCLIVSNHRSHLDVFMLLNLVPGIRVLTKHLIFLIPGLGGAAFLLRMILVKRGSEKSFWQAMETVEKVLNNNERVHVFPEMTRCLPGETKLSRFTIAPFQKAINAKVPIQPVVIWGTDMLWPKGVYKIALKAPLIVKSLESVDSTKFSSAKELSDHVKSIIQTEQIKLSEKYPFGELK
ncbi:MAG: 1-acyl-sn-glycerol-3-phosphate acyltransferase [Bdellovibrionales bacterium]|nr:1-acyl-sn-glycerol-3-phosphate acyltransferase [Bdellovibrionales bacterium]